MYSRQIILRLNRQCLDVIEGSNQICYELTPTEFKLLTPLVDNEMHTYEELNSFINNNKGDKYSRKLHITLHRIRKKLPINIITLSKHGIRLIDEVLVKD